MKKSNRGSIWDDDEVFQLINPIPPGGRGRGTFDARANFE